LLLIVCDRDASTSHRHPAPNNSFGGHNHGAQEGKR
jgi:hypothetical protein